MRKELSYPMEDGLGEFMPSQTLRMLAVDYQEGLLSRLNDEVRGEFAPFASRRSKVNHDVVLR